MDVIYMDFMKALDQVPHRRLIRKVESYDISGKVLGWVENLILYRSQCVSVNGCKSSRGKVTSGILQGSVLDHFSSCNTSTIYRIL